MRKLSLLMGSILLTTALLAQQINGSVKDPLGKGIGNATVSLLNAKDSSVAKLALTKADGIFAIGGIKSGKYLLSTSHVGFNKTFSSFFDFDGATDVTVPVLQLEKSTGD